MLDFNTPSAFKGYEIGRVSLDDIARDMEEFVNSLPPTSPHFKYIRVKQENADFTISLGLKSSLAVTLDEILEVLNRNQSQTLTDVATTSSDLMSTIKEGQHEIFSALAPPPIKKIRIAEPPDISTIDLENIQDIWDQKLSTIFESKGLSFNHFPIIESQTKKLPFKFFLRCPRCEKRLYVTLTMDLKPTGQYFKNYRSYMFTAHVVQCVTLNTQDFHDEMINYIKMEPSDEM